MADDHDAALVRALRLPKEVRRGTSDLHGLCTYALLEAVRGQGANRHARDGPDHPAEKGGRGGGGAGAGGWPQDEEGSLGEELLALDEAARVPRDSLDIQRVYTAAHAVPEWVVSIAKSGGVAREIDILAIGSYPCDVKVIDIDQFDFLLIFEADIEQESIDIMPQLLRGLSPADYIADKCYTGRYRNYHLHRAHALYTSEPHVTCVYRKDRGWVVELGWMCGGGHVHALRVRMTFTRRNARVCVHLGHQHLRGAPVFDSVYQALTADDVILDVLVANAPGDGNPKKQSKEIKADCACVLDTRMFEAMGRVSQNILSAFRLLQVFAALLHPGVALPEVETASGFPSAPLVSAHALKQILYETVVEHPKAADWGCHVLHTRVAHMLQAVYKAQESGPTEYDFCLRKHVPQTGRVHGSQQRSRYDLELLRHEASHVLEITRRLGHFLSESGRTRTPRSPDRREQRFSGPARHSGSEWRSGSRQGKPGDGCAEPAECNTSGATSGQEVESSQPDTVYRILKHARSPPPCPPPSPQSQQDASPPPDLQNPGCSASSPPPGAMDTAPCAPGGIEDDSPYPAGTELLVVTAGGLHPSDWDPEKLHRLLDFEHHLLCFKVTALPMSFTSHPLAVWCRKQYSGARQVAPGVPLTLLGPDAREELGWAWLLGRAGLLTGAETLRELRTASYSFAQIGAGLVGGDERLFEQICRQAARRIVHAQAYCSHHPGINNKDIRADIMQCLRALDPIDNALVRKWCHLVAMKRGKKLNMATAYDVATIKLKYYLDVVWNQAALFSERSNEEEYGDILVYYLACVMLEDTSHFAKRQ